MKWGQRLRRPELARGRSGQARISRPGVADHSHGAVARPPSHDTARILGVADRVAHHRGDAGSVPPLRSNIPPAASHSRSLGDAAKAGAAPKRHTTVIAVVARARFMSVPPLGGRPPTTRARAGDALAGERLQVLSRRSSSPPAAACLSGACRHEAPAAASPLTRVINARSRGHLAATTHGVESRRLQPHYPWVGMRHAPRSPA